MGISAKGQAEINNRRKEPSNHLRGDYCHRQMEESRNRNEMSRVSTTQDQQTKTPIYLSEQNQDKPVGYLFLDDNTLVLEFRGTHPEIRIKQAKANLIEIVDDSSLLLELPDNPGKRVRMYLPSDGKGRFLVYGIRKWTGIDDSESRNFRKQAFLAQFESPGAKLAVLWQLALPYTIFGITFLLQKFVTESIPEVDYFVAAWQKLALTPIVAVHYGLLVIPGIAILFFNRLWGLRTMFQMSLLLVLIVAGCSFLPNDWQFLPAAESQLFMADYWLIFSPYMILLMLPAFYYVVVMRRL